MHLPAWTTQFGHTLTGHEDSVEEVAYSLRGDLITTRSLSGKVRLWDVVTGEFRHSFVYDSKGSMAERKLRPMQSTHDFAWIPSDFNYLVTGGQDGSVRMWEVINERDVCRVRM